MPKKFKPDDTYPFRVTAKRADAIVLQETEWAAREDDAIAAVMDRHREISPIDEQISVTVERAEA